MKSFSRLKENNTNGNAMANININSHDYQLSKQMTQFSVYAQIKAIIKIKTG